MKYMRHLNRAGDARLKVRSIPAQEEAFARNTLRLNAEEDGPVFTYRAGALARAALDDWIKETLFAPAAGPQDYFPGPISRQIPFLRAALGDELRVMTLNYDDLVEQAFRDHPGAPEPYAISDEDHHVPAGKCGVVHLHGYLGRDGRPQGEIILSEADYMQMQRGTSCHMPPVAGLSDGGTVKDDPDGSGHDVTPLGRARLGVSSRGAEVYAWSVGRSAIKRTNINLDVELVEAAAAALGTARTSDTVHAALREVVDRAARERLARRDFPDLTPSVLEQLRRPRQPGR
jgi:Arc/MetJ family transcription regulator